MPTPLNNPNPLARIQPAQVTLPSLEKMRADLLKLEVDKELQPLVREIFGVQRTIVDYMRVLLSEQKNVRADFQGLVQEVSTMLSPPADAEPAQEPEAEEPAPVQPQQAPAAEKTAPPQMTVTPKPKKKNNGGAQ